MANKGKRQKATRFSIQGFDMTHYRRTEQYANAVDALFDRATMEIARMAARGEYNPDKPFSFADYPALNQLLQQESSKLADRLTTLIETGSRREWLFACDKNDGFISSIMDTSKLTKSQLKKMQDRNLDALKAFQERKIDGMGLSQRVWNYVGQYKDQMESALDVGLGEGRSAQQLARDVKQNLVEPDRLFRRVRDKRGNLVLSKAAKAYHPGQGVYRSSVKNAQRLTRSEINMAYRESDFQRWQQLDFVVGFEIMRSNHEPLCKCDTCAQLTGRYPKWFKFKGWHPQCMCFAVPILMDEETFDDNELGELKAALHGGDYKHKEAKNAVIDVPDSFKAWVNDHKDAQKNWGSTPYFVRDNFKNGLLADGLKHEPVLIVSPETGIDYSVVNEAIEDYLSGERMWINQFLRRPDGFGDLTSDEKDYLQELSAATATDVVGKQTLWRSVDARAIFGEMDDMDWDALTGHLIYGDKGKFTMQRVTRLMSGLIGKEIVEKGFMSTTRDKDVAMEWGEYTGADFPIVMKIKTTDSTRGFDIEKYTNIHHPEIEADEPQHEVLLAKGQKYKIVGIRKDGGNIVVDVELMDEAAATEVPTRKIDPIQAEIDKMKPRIMSMRQLCGEWGLSTYILDDAIQKHNSILIENALIELKKRVDSAVKELQDYITDATTAIAEARTLKVDCSVVNVDLVAAKSDRQEWIMSKAAFKKNLEALKKDIEGAKVSPLIPDELKPESKYLHGEKYTFDKDFFALLDPKQKVTLEIVDGDGGSYSSYYGTLVHLEGTQRMAASQWETKAVVYHEYGHCIDAHRDLWKNADLIAMREKQIKWLKGKTDKTLMMRTYDYSKHEYVWQRQSFKSRVAYIDARLQELSRKIWSMDKSVFEKRGITKMDVLEQIGSTRDTIKSLVISYGDGHSTKYFRGTRMKETEYLAHAFENAFLGNRVFQKVMPEIYAEMVAFVKALKPL